MNVCSGRMSLYAALVIVGGCTSTITVPDTYVEPPLVEQFDVRVGKSFAAQARSARATSALAEADVGRISVPRFNQAFDALFRHTEELEQWPPWQTIEHPELDGIIELERIDASIALGDDMSRPDSVSVSYRVCLYESADEVVACWDAGSEQFNQRGLFDCLANMGNCIEPMFVSGLNSAIAEILVDIERDPAVHVWAARTQQRRACEMAGGCMGMLWWPMSEGHDTYRFSRNIEQCLTNHLGSSLPERPMLERERVQQLLFPLLESSTQPSTEMAFAELLRREVVRERLQSRGIRYLIAFSGSTRQEDWEGGGFCGAGYGGGGCLGFVWADKTTSLDAMLWDLSSNSPLGRNVVVEEGTSVMPMLILPVPLPASTQSVACRDLAARISASISGDQ